METTGYHEKRDERVEQPGGIAKMGNTGNPQLHIDYDRETDTLWLGNGRPTPNGEDIADAVVVFFDDADRPNAVTIDHAAELLLPLLTAAKPAAPESKPAAAAPVKNAAAGG